MLSCGLGCLFELIISIDAKIQGKKTRTPLAELLRRQSQARRHRMARLQRSMHQMHPWMRTLRPVPAVNGSFLVMQRRRGAQQDK